MRKLLRNIVRQELLSILVDPRPQVLLEYLLNRHYASPIDPVEPSLTLCKNLRKKEIMKI
jgi:hypothetical protein